MFGFSRKGVDTDASKIDELLTRGVSEVIQKNALREVLLSGKKLRVKLGIDPTSPNVHLGRAVPLLKLRDFQNLGHQIIFIIGDFTGVIGDTSDKESERPMLSSGEVDLNLKRYTEQVGKILDMTKVEVRHNSEWLRKLSFADIGDLADSFSVSDFIARDNIKRRLDTGSRVSLREVLYPLMQGYDSVAVHADVELGGTDQRFNLLAGRILQPKFKQPPQHILMVNLIRGLDGRKMSSSWGNTINLLDAPSDMYGKVMSLADEAMEEYFIHATRVPLPEVRALLERCSSGSLHPKELKMRLAREIAALFHGEGAAQKAEESFKKVFEEKAVPDDVLEITLRRGSDIGEALKSAGVVSSMTEWRRLVDAGAVEEVGGATLSEHRLLAEKTTVLKIGKKRFAKIIVN